MRWGTRVHPWLIHVNVWQKQRQYCKVIGLQLKEKKKLQKIAMWACCVSWRLWCFSYEVYSEFRQQPFCKFPGLNCLKVYYLSLVTVL